VSVCGHTIAGQPRYLQIAFQSTLLSGFFNSPTYIDATVLLPPSYYKDSNRRYPVIYVVPAFEGTDQVDPAEEQAWALPMRKVGTDFIIVFLQAMVNFNGEIIHTQFADSANTGPWGTALTSEFIPQTDGHFRTIASEDARFLFGHSSGGWTVLWLQTNYPEAFNGTWALSPDPVDFHDFLGPDITKTGQNLYVDAAGHEYGMCRRNRWDTSTLRRFLLGPRSGCGVPDTEPGTSWAQRQFDTYDDVFSPALPNKKPEKLFDRQTGVIDEGVAAHWEAHYDITHLLKERWSVVGPQLRGKLHVFVGTDDTFHLDGSVMLMHSELEKLNSDAEFGFDPGADHWQIYGYHGGMIDYALAEMVERLGKYGETGSGGAASHARGAAPRDRWMAF
jgi:pimeloyl-ACP methyl ester carboxylesterase